MNGTTLPGDIPWIDAGGERRMLASFRTPREEVARFKASPYPRIPRSEWQEVDLAEAYNVKIKDQRNTSACCGYQYYATFTYAWLRGGGTFHDFSPDFMYGLINRGVDQGAYTGDTIREGINTGICLASEVPPQMIYKSQFPAQAFVTAKRFKASEAYFVPDFDDIGTVLQYHRPVGIGIEIGTRFTPDDRGVTPDLRGQLGGHDLCVMGCKKFDGIWYLKLHGSWTVQFGVRGFSYVNESYFPGSGEADNFCMVAAREDEFDPMKPPEPQS